MTAISLVSLAYGNVVVFLATGWTGTALNLTVAAALVVVALRVFWLSPKDLGLVAPRLNATLLATVGMAVAAVGVVGALRAFGVETAPDERINGLTSAGVIGKLLVTLPFGTVFLEEFLFRGFLFALWQRTTSTRSAVIFSSATFGLWHIGSAAQLAHASSLERPLVLVIPMVILATTIGGIILCAVRTKTDSLLPGSLLHWAINAAGVLLAM